MAERLGRFSFLLLPGFLDLHKLVVFVSLPQREGYNMHSIKQKQKLCSNKKKTVGITWPDFFFF